MFYINSIETNKTKDVNMKMNPLISLFQKKSNLPIRIKAIHSDISISHNIKIIWKNTKLNPPMFSTINKQCSILIAKFIEKYPNQPPYSIELFFNKQWNIVMPHNLLSINKFRKKSNNLNITLY